tara:strand:- start:40667 stop:41884 length:1218 start_codon:yes stop_codon:yes gene_type:complete
LSGPESILVAGAGAAGVSAVRALRRLGYDGALTLVDSDAAGSYERPPLSKAALLDDKSSAANFALLSDKDVRELEIEAIFGDGLVAIDPGELNAVSVKGQTFSSDRMLIATGGRARRLPIAGADATGVFTLRNFADIDAIRARLKQTGRVTVIGGGLIGAECVASFRSLGLEVVWLDVAPAPLVHILPAAIANRLTESHRQLGVDLVTEAVIDRLESGPDGVTGVRLTDGSVYPTDIVLMGVGMTPSIDLAEKAGLVLEAGGIRVSSDQQTSATGIFAAGDVAAVPEGRGWCRHEHWRAAEMQGERAAHGILGLEYETPDASWFWSDQGGHHVEMVGRKGARSVLRAGDGTLTAFEIENDVLVGAASINEPNAVRVAVRLLRAGKTPTDAELADPHQDLKKLLRA